MKIMSSIGLILLVLSVVLGGGCASRQVSQMDTLERVEIPVLLDGKVYTNSFERTDHSKLAPGVRPRAGRRLYRQGDDNISLFRFRAEVGGGGGGYGYGGGYPVITVPIESQPAFQHQTMQRYGLGGSSGSYNPTPMGGSYNPTSMGSYSPTPMR